MGDTASHDASADDGDRLNWRHLLVRLLEVRDDGIDGRSSAAHGFGKALALVRAHAGDINSDTAESCVHVVHIIHCPDEFTSCYCHEGSLSSDPPKVVRVEFLFWTREEI